MKNEELRVKNSNDLGRDWLMKNLIINIFEAAAFLLLGLGVSLFG